MASTGPKSHGGGNRILSRAGSVAAIPSSILSLVKLRQGDLLFEKGSALDRLYFPHSLVASMLVVSHNGDSVDVATIGCEGLLGPFLPGGKNLSVTRQIVQVSGAATVVDRAEWFRLIEKEPAIGAIAAAYQDAFMIQVIQSVACNALHTSEERFARWLLMMDDRSPGGAIALTHEVVGKMLGVRRPTVTLIAGAFQRAGHIMTSRGRIHISDRPGLEAVACECYQIIKTSYEALLGSTSGAVAAAPPALDHP